MSVVDVREVWAGRSGSEDWKYHRKYHRVFFVQTSSGSDGPVEVMAAPGIGKGDGFPDDSEAYAVQVAATAGDSPFVWTVTVDYDSVVDQDPATSDANPVDRPPIYSFSFVDNKKVVFEDLSDTPLPLVNPAGVPIDPPVEVDWPLLQMTIEKNKDPGSFTIDDMIGLEKKVNNADYGDFPTHSLLCAGVEVKEVFENNAKYYQTKYVLLYNVDLWIPTKILSLGFSVKDGATLVLARDKYGTPYPNPVLLDSSGHITTTPYFMEFQLYYEGDFSAIP